MPTLSTPIPPSMQASAPTWRQLGQRLYVRIWLAVVLTVAVLTMLLGWAWRMAAEQPLHELHVRNTAGEVIGSAQRRMVRPPPSAGMGK